MLKCSLYKTRLQNPNHNSEELVCYLKVFPVNFEYFFIYQGKIYKGINHLVCTQHFLKNYHFLPPDTYQEMEGGGDKKY